MTAPSYDPQNEPTIYDHSPELDSPSDGPERRPPFRERKDDPRERREDMLEYAAGIIGVIGSSAFRAMGDFAVEARRKIKNWGC